MHTSLVKLHQKAFKPRTHVLGKRFFLEKKSTAAPQPAGALLCSSSSASSNRNLLQRAFHNLPRGIMPQEKGSHFSHVSLIIVSLIGFLQPCSFVFPCLFHTETLLTYMGLLTRPRNAGFGSSRLFNLLLLPTSPKTVFLKVIKWINCACSALNVQNAIQKLLSTLLQRTDLLCGQGVPARARAPPQHHPGLPVSGAKP